MTNGENGESLTWAHVGDLHITGEDEPNYRDFLSIIEEINTHLAGQIDSCVLPGDNADDGSADQYALIRRGLERLKVPIHSTAAKTIGIPRARPTMDIDMLRKGKADQTSLLALVKDCATLEVEADGLTFLANSAVAEEITKNSEYKGTRILMDARMDNVRLRIQIDFGVGDVMVPGPRMIEYPVLLGNDTIKLLAYPVESAIAEKLQAMVALGTANSRMKDFYDVRICSNHLDFNTDILFKAVDATFRNRETPVAVEDSTLS
jgi:Nucleotidyl transferase AbiEii toxin, Type IV TA system